MDREKEAIDKLKEYGQNHIVNILEKLKEYGHNHIVNILDKLDESK